MSVMAKVPKKQRIIIFGATGAIALFLLYRWYASRSAAANTATGDVPMSDTGVGSGAGDSGGGGVDLSGIQTQIDKINDALGQLPTYDDYSQLPAIFAGMIPPPGDTNTGGVAGGAASGGNNSGGASPAASSPLPGWLTTAAKKLGGTISTDVTGAAGAAPGAKYLLSSPASGGSWHTYYTEAGKIARQVFVASPNANTTSHQGGSVPGTLQGNGAIAVVDHAVKSVAASVPKPKSGYQFIQDSGSRAGLSYNVVQKSGSNYRFYENGDKVKI